MEMKLVNFKAGEQIRFGIQTAQGIIDVEKAAATYSLDIPTSMNEAIAKGEEGLSQLTQLINKEVETLSEEEIIYAPCVLDPEKIICVGLNYVDHAKESNMEIPTYPVLFSKFNNALASHKEIIPLPKNAVQFDYEAELVIVIGKEATNVTKEDALSYVFGYTVGNDLSARDLQFRTPQWLLGKTLDHFGPIGPSLVTADEIDPAKLDISLKVNGEIKQSANTSQMIFDCATIVSYLSQHVTLKPGDIIFSGTPDGVVLGYPEDQRQWLKSGDKVEVYIEKIGTLVNVLE
jgi:2-keto-4-pentenoate hydratase/2-oxohepta-3-ene-1,7-dioic acid hydratase in catechol pathway